MKQLKVAFVVVMMALFFGANAQKSADGLKFKTCLNKKELPAGFYKGKYLVLDFWTTWCGPCIGSFPKVDALQKKYKAHNDLVFAAISPESEGLLDSFFHRKKDMMPGVLHLVDDSSATWRYFEVNYIPNLLVFAPSGAIVFSGHIEELSRCMDKILKGENRYNGQKETKPKVDKWAQIQESAAYMAIVINADSTESGGSNASFNKDYSRIDLRSTNQALADVIVGVGNLTSLALKYNDSLKANTMISMYYKQVQNNFPEFDNGIFKYPYQNHILDLLGKLYSFHAKWVTDKMPAYKVVVQNKELLNKASTLSTKGSYMSVSDPAKKKCNYVNQELKSVAAAAESYLDIPFTSESITGGYDFELEFSSLSALERSLSTYGLGLEKIEEFEMKRLSLTFY